MNKTYVPVDGDDGAVLSLVGPLAQTAENDEGAERSSHAAFFDANTMVDYGRRLITASQSRTAAEPSFNVDGLENSIVSGLPNLRTERRTAERQLTAVFFVVRFQATNKTQQTKFNNKSKGRTANAAKDMNNKRVGRSSREDWWEGKLYEKTRCPTFSLSAS